MDEKQAKAMFLQKLAESFGQYVIEENKDQTRKRLAAIGALAGAGFGAYHRHTPMEAINKLKVNKINPFHHAGAVESAASKVLLHPEVYKALKKISPALMIGGGLLKGNIAAKILYDFAAD